MLSQRVSISECGIDPASVKPGSVFRRRRSSLYFDRAENLYQRWMTPVCIIVDGPYGVRGFPGDPPTVEPLPEWYRPHIEAWAKYSTPQTTLWFWGTELGWATVHPAFVDNGFTYRSCHIWDKGASHVAGNANSLTLRKFPVVTEVCVQYVKAAQFPVNGSMLLMQDWLRYEWERTGLPFYRSNEATGTRNAATRKYLTGDHLWYFPPVEAFTRLAAYANEHGKPEGRPYFSVDGKHPIAPREWAKMRAKFNCEVGIHNVWREPPVRGNERLKKKYRHVHNSQKPIKLIDICIRSSTDRGDVVWEPFGGLCTAAVVSYRLGRVCYSAEIIPEYYAASVERLATQAKR